MRHDDAFRLLDEYTAFAAMVVLIFLGWLVLHLQRVA